MAGEDLAPAIARARAVPIGNFVKLHRVGAWLKGRCPLHDDHDPSFGVIGDHWKCFSGCGSGDVIDLYQRLRHVSWLDAVHSLAGEAAGAAGGPAPTQYNRSGSPSPDGRRPLGQAEAPAREDALVKKLWAEAQHPRLAEMYLATRGINVRPRPLPASLRGHSAVWCSETRKARPCVLAALESVSGRLCALQRVWVESRIEFDGSTDYRKGSRARDLETPKKTLGNMQKAMVWLCEPGEELGISEGFESGLAATAMFSIGCAATCGLSRLGHPGKNGRPDRPPTVELPPEVRRVIVFGDNGDAGREVAYFAAWYWRRQGLLASAEFPSEGFSDFNDELLGIRQ